MPGLLSSQSMVGAALKLRNFTKSLVSSLEVVGYNSGPQEAKEEAPVFKVSLNYIMTSCPIKPKLVERKGPNISCIENNISSPDTMVFIPAQSSSQVSGNCIRNARAGYASWWDEKEPGS